MIVSSEAFVTAWWIPHLQMLAFRFYEFQHVRLTRQRRFVSKFRVFFVHMRELLKTPPNKSPEPTAVGAVSSAISVHAAIRRWLSFFR